VWENSFAPLGWSRGGVPREWETCFAQYFQVKRADCVLQVLQQERVQRERELADAAAARSTAALLGQVCTTTTATIFSPPLFSSLSLPSLMRPLLNSCWPEATEARPINRSSSSCVVALLPMILMVMLRGWMKHVCTRATRLHPLRQKAMMTISLSNSTGATRPCPPYRYGHRHHRRHRHFFVQRRCQAAYNR
jgi:hypothetical protein